MLKKKKVSAWKSVRCLSVCLRFEAHRSEFNYLSSRTRQSLNLQFVWIAWITYASCVSIYIHAIPNKWSSPRSDERTKKKILNFLLPSWKIPLFEIQRSFLFLLNKKYIHNFDQFCFFLLTPSTFEVEHNFFRRWWLRFGGDGGSDGDDGGVRMF